MAAVATLSTVSASPILTPFSPHHQNSHRYHQRRARSRCHSLYSPEPEDHNRYGSSHSLGHSSDRFSQASTNTAFTEPSSVAIAAAASASATAAASASISQPLSLDSSPIRRHKSAAHKSPIASEALPRVHSLNMAIPRPRGSPLQMPVPDSPPDLSSSKSSKSSSSFRSSILSDSVGPESITHFEDISLNESKRDSYDLHAHATKDARNRPQPRPLHSMMGARKKPFPTVDTMRSVHTAQRRPGTASRPNGVLDDKSTNIPVGRVPRPGYRSSSGSFGPPSPTSRFVDSRSPSPSKDLIRNHGLVRSSASAPSGFLGINGPTRRKTWAPGQRKTVKQLEDEYHDSDEDVPDDAIIWNVPLSPLEPFAALSRDRSPHRKSSQSSLSSNGKSASLSRQQSAPSPPAADSIEEIPRHMLTLPRSATTGSFPDSVNDGFALRERHQSWANDLCDDARHISAALEAHATRGSVDSSRSHGSHLGSAPILRRASTSLASLPPIQKSNIMIDPLPISKEKEAVLTRTRPSWLPPKCKKEERRHIKQWEKMMAHSAVAEQRRAVKQLEEIENLRHTRDSSEKIWEEQVLPNWDQVVKEPRIRELWWRGINSKNRGKVWSKAIGNDLHLSSASYAAALERSQSLDTSITERITAGVTSAFPETGLFVEGSPLHSSLNDVLKAHASYRSDVGYVSGMHSIAALLLLNMSAEDAFVSLANILNRPMPLAFLTNDRTGIDQWAGLVMSTLKVKLPALHDHFLSEKLSLDTSSTSETTDELAPPTLSLSAAESISGSRPASRAGHIVSPRNAVPTELITPMLSTVFTSHLDLETLSRIWDIYVFESDKLAVRAFVGLCSRIESQLYGSKQEILAVLGHEGAKSDVWHRLGEVEGVILDIREAGKAGGAQQSSPKR